MLLIHYEGFAASPDAIVKILATVVAFAEKKQWKVKDASSAYSRLQRVIDEKSQDYEGKITGLVIHVSDNCEPLHFQFGDDLFMQDYVKTQFAGADIHIQIVQLLNYLRPHFKNIDVVDEGEYWDLHDKTVLEGHIAKIDSVIEDIKKNNPKAQGPLRMESGRIADVIQ